MNLRRGVFLCLVAAVTSGCGFIGGYLVNPIPVRVEGQFAFDVSPKLNLPTLQAIIAGSETDEQAYRAIGAYYTAHRAAIRAALQEQDDRRLKALFVMYIVHISHPYNTVDRPAETFVGYVNRQPASHCGWYAHWQNRINLVLGLTSRKMMTSSADHGWVEVEIDGHWEIFDSTVNLWLSESAVDLAQGKPRQYREFYLIAATDAAPYPSVVKLRQDMIGMGYNYPKGQTIVRQETQ